MEKQLLLLASATTDPFAGLPSGCEGKCRADRRFGISEKAPQIFVNKLFKLPSERQFNWVPRHQIM
jgi:hypothetical protein